MNDLQRALDKLRALAEEADNDLRETIAQAIYDHSDLTTHRCIELAANILQAIKDRQ